MSVATSVIPFGMGCIGTWIYTAYHHKQLQKEDMNRLEREKQINLELEEEIVRLKREMRICGIKTSSDERSR
jgi:hypothetical protein